MRGRRVYVELRGWAGWCTVKVPGLRDLRLSIKASLGYRATPCPREEKKTEKGGSQLKVVRVIEQRGMLRWASWKWGLDSSQL